MQIVKPSEEILEEAEVKEFTRPPQWVAAQMINLGANIAPLTREEIKREKYLDKRVSLPYYEMRQAIMQWDPEVPLSIDKFMEKYFQPREPVKKALDELCNFDKISKTYTLKQMR
jgi:hypothetical protein